jgi:RNA polymerase sigma-70 factor, ECF subfamily
MTSMATAPWVSELAERHLDAAYNLGRWLLGNEQDAADAVHDAYLRAARSAHTYAGGNARAWWLAIVRNCCIAALNARKRVTPHADIGAVIDAAASAGGARGSDAEDGAQSAERRGLVEKHLRALPVEYREALVLREIEDLSYREIADVLGVPIGTVMSRLARARAQIKAYLDGERPALRSVQ